MDKSEERMRQGEPIQLGVNMTPIIIAAVLGFIVVALFVILRKRSSARRDIVLTGLSESGKTSVFMTVLYEQFPDTFTSIKENVDVYKRSNSTARLIDVPGHYRVRDKCFEQYKKTAKGIVFVIDSVTIQKEIRDVADALYSTLTDAATVSCHFLILCNKQDLTTAKTMQVIESSLEKEMNIVRDTRSRKLQSTAEDETNTVYLGKPGKSFEWSHLQQRISFIQGSAKDGEVSELVEWIEKLL